MAEIPVITKEKFVECLEKKVLDLGGTGLWSRVLAFFEECENSPPLAWDVTNIFMYAVDQGKDKVEEVLELLKEHYEDHLQGQHPEIRGQVAGDFNVNLTHELLTKIRDDVLKVESRPAQ